MRRYRRVALSYTGRGRYDGVMQGRHPAAQEYFPRHLLVSPLGARLSVCAGLGRVTAPVGPVTFVTFRGPFGEAPAHRTAAITGFYPQNRLVRVPFALFANAHPLGKFDRNSRPVGFPFAAGLRGI